MITTILIILAILILVGAGVLIGRKNKDRVDQAVADFNKLQQAAQSKIDEIKK